MAGLGTGAPIVRVYHEKSMILPDVSRVLACLYEKDIEFERHTSSYKSLLRLQASSHAPVPFYDGLKFLEESREICRYIAETYEHQGYPFLLGKDSLERASIEQWLHHEEHNFNPVSRSLFCHLAFPLAEEDDDIDLQKRKLEEVLEVYEQRLGDSEFLAGNKFTLADLVHLPNSHYITESDKFAYLYDSRKNVQRWWNAISTRKSWQNVLKDIQVVEQQRKQEEFEKQQQRQWLRERPRTTRRKIRIDSRRQTSTKPQTILVPPPDGIISTSPEASQAEKPLPTRTSPGETPLSTPTTRKSSTVQKKHTTIFTTQQETPPAPIQSTPRLPGYSHNPVQSTSNSSTPATFPTTAENPSRSGADRSKIRGFSLPSEATEIDLPPISKQSSSKEVSNNLRVFDFYEASKHTDEAEPYIEPNPQRPLEKLDRISETNGSSNATDHVKTSPRSAKEDSGVSGFVTDNTATNADTLDKKSVRYSETIYGRSTDQRATYTSPWKHGSTEAYQGLQSEQWHGTAAGSSNLKGETDYSMPAQQVKPGKDVQHSSSQDSEQVSAHPLAQERAIMDRQLVQGPEMTPRTLYTDQKRDVSSMLWQKTADVREIAEEDKASSDHRDVVLPPYARKDVEEAKIVSADHRNEASLPKRVKDEDTQAIPFQIAYDDAHDISREERETASAPRRRTQNAYDNVPQHTPPSKQAASEGPQHATTPYPAAQEFIKQARGSPASRSTVPPDTQGSTEETGESASSKAYPLGSHLTDARPPKELLDKDRYGSVAPLRTRYADDPYNRKRDRDAAAPKEMISQDAFEESKMSDSAPFEAQTFDPQRANAPPQKQRPAEDPHTIASPLKKGYSGGEDTTKQSKDASSIPRGMAAQEVQDTFKEYKAGDSLSTRQPPSDTWRSPPPLPRHQVDDDHSTTAPTQKRYPGTRGTIKEVEENTYMPQRVAGGDAKEMLEETKFAESASLRAQATNYEDQRNAVFPVEKKLAPPDQDSVYSVQKSSPAETRKGETIVTAAEQTLPTHTGQQHTQDMRGAPTSDFVPTEDMPSDARSGRPDEVALAEQKFASSDQDTQPASSAEPRNEEIRNSTRAEQALLSTADDQTKDPHKTTIGRQDVVPTPTSKYPSSDTHHASGEFQEVAPDDHHNVESLPSQGQVSRTKPSFVLSGGPTRDSLDMDKNTTKLPSSQAQSSDPKLDSTQNRSDEPPTVFLPRQLPKQHAKTQALPPLVDPNDSKSSKDVTSSTLGEAKSPKSSSTDQEATGSALTHETHLGSAPAGVAPAGHKLLLKDQDSTHPTQKSSSSEPTKEQSIVTAPNEAKTSPTIFTQQDVARAQTKMKYPSSGSQYVPQRLQEITPKEQRITGSIPMQQEVPHFEHISQPLDGKPPDPHGAFVEEPMVDTTSPIPHAQDGMLPSGLSPDEEKPEISDKYSDRHTQLRSSAGSRKDEGGADASDQTTMPTTGTSEFSGEILEVGPSNHRSSELTRPLIPSRKQDTHDGHPESHAGPSPDAHRAVADENKPPPLVSQARSLEAGLNYAPSSDDAIPTSGDEPVAGLINEHEKQTLAAPPEATSVPADAFGKVGPLKATGKVTPADQSTAPSEPLPVRDSRKESTGAEAGESKVYQPVTGQKDIRHAPGISERVLDGDNNKEPVSREELVSHDQRASAPPEGSPPDVHGASLDKTTPLSSQTKSSDPKRDSLPKSVDLNPSSGQQSATRILHGQGAQLPALTRSPALHESRLYPKSENVPESFRPLSANQEVMSPKVNPAAAQDTILSTASDEMDPDGQNFPLPARSAQRAFSIEPTKEKGVTASSHQTNETLAVIGQREVTATDKEKTPFDLQASELAKLPNEDQEQAHARTAYEQPEGPTRDARGPVDEKMPHPSSQEENSDIAPDSAPVSGTSVNGPSTSSLRVWEEQPPTGTQNAPALFLEKIKSPTPPSTDQKLMTPMTSPTLAPEAPQDQDLTTLQLSPSVVPRKDVADQTNVAQAGLREPTSSDSEKIKKVSPDAYFTKSEKSLRPMKDEDSTEYPQLSPSVVPREDGADGNQTDVPQAGPRVPRSSDATKPSEKIQEISPDASLSKSAKPLFPLTGTDPVQSPHEASFALPSDGKPTMIRGEQANTVSNISLSASQAVGKSENSAVKRPLSEESVSSFSPKNLERILPEEKTKQQQSDQYSTRSSNGDSIEASGTANPNIKTTRDLQPSLLEGSMHATEGARNQEQAEQAVLQSTQDDRKQIHENEVQYNGSDGPKDIRPYSAPISGDARRTLGDEPATSSLRESQEQPPAGTLNVPAVSLEKMESPRPPSTGQELMTSKTSPAPAPDAPQDQDSTRSPQLSPSVVSRKHVANADRTNVSQAGPREPATSGVTRPSAKTQEFSPDAYLTKSENPLPTEGSNPVQTPHEASFGSSSAEKPTMIKGDQANTISNVSLSASQAVGQSDNGAVKGPLSEDLVSPLFQKSVEGTSPQEKPNQEQKTDRSNTRSSNDDSIVEARGTTYPDISTSGDIPPSPLKKNTQAAEGSREQLPADQDVDGSTLDDEKQFEETEARVIGPDELYETNLQQRLNQKNNGPSQMDAFAQPEGVPAVQPRSNDTNIGSKPTKEAPGRIQGDNKPDSSSRTSKESEQQVQTEGKTQGGETKAPTSESEQPEERALPLTNKDNTSQSQAETLNKPEVQPSSSIQSIDTGPSKLDGSADDVRSAPDAGDNPPST